MRRLQPTQTQVANMGSLRVKSQANPCSQNSDDEMPGRTVGFTAATVDEVSGQTVGRQWFVEAYCPGGR